jgi:hypothetical protein
MGNRIRLTDSRRRASDDTPYSGTVNQDRKFVESDKYNTFEQTVNYELPDMRTDWRNDSRDEIGFPIAEEHPQVGIEDEGQKIASYSQLRQAASKAVKLSMLLLGNKVPDKMIEAQAQDFMRLGSEAIERSLDRFAKTEEMYAAEEDEDDKEETPVAKKGAEEDKPAEDGEKKEAGEKKDLPPEFLENIQKNKDKAEDKKEEAPKAKKGAEEEEKKDEPVAKKGAEDDKEEDKKDEPVAKKSAEDDKEETPVAKKGAEEDDKEEAPKAKKSSDDEDEDDETFAKKGMVELDIDMTAGEEEDEEGDAAAQKVLSSLFEEVKRQGAKSSKASDEDAEDEAKEEEPKARSASASAKARGAQKLGGQPRVASENMSVNDISKIWGTTPDVSDLFD